jgi:excisionase family DNA binding protein
MLSPYSLSSFYGRPLAVVPPTPPTPPPASHPASLLRDRISAAWASGRLRLPPFIRDWAVPTPEIKACAREMLNHSVVKPALLSKVFAVASQDLQIHPADESPTARDIADFHTYAFERSEGGTMQVAQSILLGPLIDGYGVMHAPMEVISRGKWAGKWAFARFKDKDTARLWPLTDAFLNVEGVVGHEQGGQRVWSANGFGDNLIVTTYLPLWGSPTGLSDLSAAYWPWYRMVMAEQFRAIHLEKYLSPGFVGTYPLGDLQLKNDLERAMEDFKSGTWMSVPAGTVVEALQIATRGEKEFDDAIKAYQDQIVLAINFATLQMLVANAGADLRGDSRVQQSTSELAVWYLSRLVVECYNRRLLPLQTEVNFAGADAPTASLGSVNDADLTASLQIDQGLAQLGFKHSASALAKYYGRQQSTDPADQLGGEADKETRRQGDKETTPFADQPGTAAPVPYTLDMGPLWKVRQVAQALNFSPGKVRDLCRSGELGYVPFGRSVRVPERALLAYVESCQKGGQMVPFADSFCGGKGGTPGPCPEGGGEGKGTDASAPLAAGGASPAELTHTVAHLTDSQKADLSDYTQEGHETMNAALRSGKGKVPAELRAKAAALDAALDAAPVLDKPAVVHRGMMITADKKEAFLAQMDKLNGSKRTLTNHGYVSTSLDPQVAGVFALPENPENLSVNLEIKARKGLYLEGVTGNPGEQEFLLPRGTKFRVTLKSTSRHPGGGKAVTYQLEQV